MSDYPGEDKQKTPFPKSIKTAIVGIQDESGTAWRFRFLCPHCGGEKIKQHTSGIQFIDICPHCFRPVIIPVIRKGTYSEIKKEENNNASITNKQG